MDAWDDSVLVNAYKDGVSLYKQYHSGQTPVETQHQSGAGPSHVESQQKKHKKRGNRGGNKLHHKKHSISSQGSRDQAANSSHADSISVASDHHQHPQQHYSQPQQHQPQQHQPQTHQHSHNQQQQHYSQPQQHQQQQYQHGHNQSPHDCCHHMDTQTPGRPPLPPELAGDAHLANLVLAWYYSGYWTGYYQASRQGQQ
eukprot:c7598_g1_i1.p2 GENE.c7598_g1_i1~~c7598_g1_i1.p2  ORF type:complete len:199 (+),score=49.77 c7598_g1_i1:45-641(+)